MLKRKFIKILFTNKNSQFALLPFFKINSIKYFKVAIKF